MIPRADFNNGTQLMYKVIILVTNKGVCVANTKRRKKEKERKERKERKKKIQEYV